MTFSVRVFGLSPIDDPVAVKKRIGYVAEDQVLPAGSTIAELIAFHRYLFPRWDESLESQLVDRIELSAGSKIKHLSKGQARQVALLCAVCHRPELLILDEPAGGLDPAARREFLETSIQLLNREGTAILFSSHHMTDVERIGGRVVLLDQGKAVCFRCRHYRANPGLPRCTHGLRRVACRLAALYWGIEKLFRQAEFAEKPPSPEATSGFWRMRA